MKHYIYLALLLLSNVLQAQQTLMREETDEAVGLLTSAIPLQLEPHLFSCNAILMLPKDTLKSPDYIFSFFYKTPNEITLDTTSEVEISFWDGSLYSFPYFNYKEVLVPKDSLICFRAFLSPECIKKMKELAINDFNFITPVYNQKIIIEGEPRMFLSMLARYLLEKQAEEYGMIYK